MRFALFGMALLVSGCTPQVVQYAYKPDTSVSQKDRDTLECEVAASQAVSPNVQIGTTPVFSTPVQTSCYNIGNSVQCRTTGGQVSGGRTYSYDANASLRRDVAAQCLVDRGYRLTPLPVCASNKATPEARQRLSGQLQAPRDGACVLQISPRGTNALNPLD